MQAGKLSGKTALVTGASSGIGAATALALAAEGARVAIAAQLRDLADQIEALPLDGAAEVLSWLGDLIERLLCEADHILRAQPGQGRT